MTRVAQYQLVTDRVIAATAAVDQGWIVSAMQKHGPVLVKLLWRILGNEPDVCDVYQETFVHLIRCERKPRHIKAYLLGAAANVAVAVLRRRLVHQRLCREHAEQLTRCNCPVDYGAELDSHLLQQHLRDHIARLPEHLRTVVVLRDFGELSYREVAAALNITHQTARIYRHRAIRLLAHALAKGRWGSDYVHE